MFRKFIFIKCTTILSFYVIFHLQCPRLQFYDAKAEVFKFEAKLKKQKKHPHEGLLLPVKIH